MTDRLKAARSERAQAIEEKDSFLQKYYMEKKIRKEAEDKVGVVTPLSINVRITYHCEVQSE